MLLFFLSFLLHQIPLLLVSLLIFLVGMVSNLWDRYCLSRVEYNRHLSSRRVFFGEQVMLELEIANKKPLPLPWLQIDDEIPEDVTLLKGRTSPSYLMKRRILTNILSLNWYHKVTRRYPLSCQERGVFMFGPARMRSGDLFGFFTRDKNVEKIDKLVVYPKIVSLEKLGLSSMQPMGDIRTRSHLFQDPVLTMGIREYSQGDSLRRIHWKSTARLGALQTKVFEPTTTIDMGIFMDVRTVKPPLWGVIPDLLELVIVVAASLSQSAIDQGYRVGLYANQHGAVSNGFVRIPPSQHPAQLSQILEALAQVHATDALPISRLVNEESRNLPWGSTMVVITAVPNEALFSSLAFVRSSGRKVFLIIVGDSEFSSERLGVTILHVSDGIKWRDLNALNLGERN